MNEYSVNIEVKDGDGKIICSQPYNEFMYGTKNCCHFHANHGAPGTKTDSVQKQKSHELS